MTAARDILSADFDNEYLFANSTDGKLRILLLEDRQQDAELIQLALRKFEMEFELKHVLNKEGYQDGLENWQPHFVISDYNLPQYTGMEALLDLKARNPFVPFIISTGSLNEEIAVECIKAGADDYVLKDSPGRLPSAIHNALANKQTLVDKERASAELQKSEAKFRALSENAPEIIFQMNKEGKIIYCNRPYEFDRAEFVFDLFHAESRNALSEAIGSVFAGKIVKPFEMRGKRDSDTKLEWYLSHFGAVKNGEEVEAAVFIPSDISQQKEDELALQQLNERLQELNMHIENVRDEEKERIAIEIHDQLGQELTGNKLGLYWIQQHLKQNGLAQSDEGLVNQKVNDLIELTTQTIQTVRRIAHELRPVVLDKMGLVPALEWHVENFNKTNTTQCTLVADVEDLKFSKDFNTTIYRITQEALTNISRHAQAEGAWIELISDHRTLNLVIRDNGVGIDMEKAKKSKSMGLFGIGTRIKTWHGALKISGGPGEGTTIDITFNLDNLKAQ